MSHFFTLVLLDPKINADNIEEEIGKLLAAYSEELEVKPYSKKCFCVGRKADLAGHKSAEARFGDMDALRGSFKAVLFKKYGEACKNPGFETASNSGDINKLWLKHIRPMRLAAASATKKHAEYNKPDAACTECKGTGRRKTTYNPKTKFDWWCLGGRWRGYLPTKAEGVKDVSMASAYLGLVDQQSGDNFLPFALVTPDGEWFERGKMGWFGHTYDLKKDDEWRTIVKKILKKYPASLAAVCDLHI